MAGKKDDPQELSFGKTMTNLLIPKNIRSTPKEVFKGVAFIGFICFFLFSFLARGCRRDATEEQHNQRESAVSIFRSV